MCYGVVTDRRLTMNDDNYYLMNSDNYYTINGVEYRWPKRPPHLTENETGGRVVEDVDSGLWFTY